ncbi:MAG TPA: hypothetical protein VNU95_13115, partial [Candidatus Acidoferrales bacterium]|nr:hypothetical protein [Candidatus Acidoferrales bacterium]
VTNCEKVPEENNLFSKDPIRHEWWPWGWRKIRPYVSRYAIFNGNLPARRENAPPGIGMAKPAL